MSLFDWTKDAQALIREWQGDAAEQERVAKRLTGVERSAAIAHGNTKAACASALQRLMWTHGFAPVPKGVKP
ncbi:hypothetical protein ACVCL0_09110 [Rhodanobacter sp. UC4450_H17]